MTNRLRQLILPGVLLLALGGLAACGGGSDDGGNGEDEDGDGGNGGGNAAQQLFVEVGCAECHGDEGQGNGTDANTELIGTRMIIAQFETRVRNGRGSAMPGYTAEQISNEQIAELWEWLRSQ
jgi:mono/diheme cytochrome c family protein